MPISLPRLELVRILFDHAKDVPAILEAVQAIGKAEDAGGKYDAFLFALQLLSPVVHDIAPYLGDGFAAAEDEQGVLAGLQADAAERGIDWSKLWAVLPQIISALELILPLVLGDKPLGSAE